MLPTIIISVICGWVSFILLMVVVSRLKRKNLETKTLEGEVASLEAHYSELLREKERLSKEVEDKRTVVAAANEVIEQRLALLGKLFAGVIIADGRVEQEAVSEIEALVEDREVFVRTVRTVLDAIRPGFINHLKESGLTEGQTDCCCLYAIGLRGKDIANYLGRKSLYNDSIEIRRKLGLNAHDTNLGNYLRRLLDAQKLF